MPTRQASHDQFKPSANVQHARHLYPTRMTQLQLSYNLPRTTRRACSAASIQARSWNARVVHWPSGPTNRPKRCELVRPRSLVEMAKQTFSMYQEYLCKNLTEKYSHINSQLDRVVNEANTQLQNLQKKIQSEPLAQRSCELTVLIQKIKVSPLTRAVCSRRTASSSTCTVRRARSTHKLSVSTTR